MKKMICLLLALTILAVLAACGKEDESVSDPVSTEQAETEASAEETLPSETQSLDYLKVEIKEKYDGAAAGYKFRVGAAKAIITPQVGTLLTGYSPARESKSVNDDLNMIVFAFEQNGRVILSCAGDLTNCGDKIKSFRLMVSDATGIPKEDIYLSVSHMHSGPDMFSEVEKSFYDVCAEAAKEAIANLQWAEMGVSTIHSEIGINRRQVLEDGSVILGQNPDGPYDPTMTVISFRNHKKQCIGNMIHYGAHNTGSGQNSEITRDWCGVMKDAVENLTGGITGFYNGAQGDVGPRLSNGGTTGNLQLALELGKLAGKDACDCWNAITEWKKDCEVKQVKAVIKVPYLQITEEEIKKQIDELNSAEIKTKDDTDHLNGLVSLLPLVQKHQNEGGLSTEASYFAVGDVCFALTPFENFTDMVLDIRERSPYKYTLVVSNSNGRYAYFPDRAVIETGRGYEVRQYWLRSTYYGQPWLALDGTEYYADEALKLIEQMYSD